MPPNVPACVPWLLLPESVVARVLLYCIIGSHSKRATYASGQAHGLLKSHARPAARGMSASGNQHPTQ
eukprot:scaffold156220_cov43-Prasinocladus_malaysianus.AAC.1